MVGTVSSRAMDQAGLPCVGAIIDVLWDDRDEVFRGTVAKRGSASGPAGWWNSSPSTPKPSSPARRRRSNSTTGGSDSAAGLRVHIAYHDGDRLSHNLNDITWRYAGAGRWYEPGDAAEMLLDARDASFDVSLPSSQQRATEIDEEEPRLDMVSSTKNDVNNDTQHLQRHNSCAKAKKKASNNANGVVSPKSASARRGRKRRRQCKHADSSPNNEQRASKETTLQPMADEDESRPMLSAAGVNSLCSALSTEAEYDDEEKHTDKANDGSPRKRRRRCDLQPEARADGATTVTSASRLARAESKSSTVVFLGESIEADDEDETKHDGQVSKGHADITVNIKNNNNPSWEEHEKSELSSTERKERRDDKSSSVEKCDTKREVGKLFRSTYGSNEEVADGILAEFTRDENYLISFLPSSATSASSHSNSPVTEASVATAPHVHVNRPAPAASVSTGGDGTEYLTKKLPMLDLSPLSVIMPAQLPSAMVLNRTDYCQQYDSNGHFDGEQFLNSLTNITPSPISLHQPEDCMKLEEEQKPQGDGASMGVDLSTSGNNGQSTRCKQLSVQYLLNVD